MCLVYFLSYHLFLDILSNNQSLSSEGSAELWGNMEKGDPTGYQEPDGATGEYTFLKLLVLESQRKWVLFM